MNNETKWNGEFTEEKEDDTNNSNVHTVQLMVDSDNGVDVDIQTKQVVETISIKDNNDKEYEDKC